MALMKLSRRQFARAASATVAAALIGRRAHAQTAPAAAADSAGQSLPPIKLPPPAQAESDARVQLVLSRWNARLSPGERRLVAHLCAETQETLDAVRAFALDITDAPAPIFVAARRKR